MSDFKTSDERENAIGAAIVFSFCSGIAISAGVVTAVQHRWGWTACNLLMWGIFAVATVRADRTARGTR